jgi:hypothetical protein
VQNSIAVIDEGNKIVFVYLFHFSPLESVEIIWVSAAIWDNEKDIPKIVDYAKGFMVGAPGFEPGTF